MADTPREAAIAQRFYNRPKQVGRVLAILGCVLIFVTSFFTPDPTLKEIGRFGGGALLLLALFAYGFGMLTSAMGKSPRERDGEGGGR